MMYQSVLFVRQLQGPISFRLTIKMRDPSLVRSISPIDSDDH